MNWRIVRDMSMSFAFFLPALVLAGGDSRLAACVAGACDSYAAGSASVDTQASRIPVLQASPPAVGFDKIAQTDPGKCQTCCTRNQAACHKRKEEGRLCEFKHTKCVAHCDKQGKMPSDWFCWWQPDMTW